MTNLPAERIGKNAALIGGITALSRIAGFARVLVLAWAVGLGGVLDVYNTANRVPNILYEIVAGGALAALVVPLLAAPLARSESKLADQTASALLTWTVLVLAPVGVLVAVAAKPVMLALIGGHGAAEAEVEMGTRMIQIFAPQLPLYGIGVVLTGILHSRRRFVWPAIAPLLSSVTVITAYFGYAMMSRRGDGVAEVPLSHELVLSIGTTCATVVMTFCLLIPLRRIGITLKPTLSFGDAELAKRARGTALSGTVSIAAWQISLLLTLALTNGGPRGTVGLFSIALTLYMLPWGVFAMPLALASYPALSQAHALGDEKSYARTLAPNTRRVLLLGCLGMAALVGMAVPLAAIFARIGGSGDVAAGVDPVQSMSDAVTALGLGAVGFALFPLLTRALYARGDMVSAAIATIFGWSVSYAAAIVFSVVLPIQHRAFAVAIGNAVGMVTLGAALLTVVAIRSGGGALQGMWRAGAAGLLAAAVSAGVGRGVANLWGTTATLSTAVLAAVASGCMIVLVFGVVVYAIDRRDMHPLANMLRLRVSGRQ